VKTIKLQNHEWSYEETDPLGAPGGFGEVFRGEGTTGAVAVKRLKLSAAAAAHRELTIGASLANRDLRHIVPVLDYGQDANSDRYFLVMPICERSLQQEVAGRGSIPPDDVRQITLGILAGLREAGDIVHRDLKPSNILFCDGGWRIADFGIAKFVEDSTSLETLRGFLTHAYGAPEQWEGQRPTQATDVYALGCIIHTMITGAPPFTGSIDQIREAHLHKAPPALPQLGDRLGAFVNLMLRKTQMSRPSVDRCLEVFAEAATPIASPARAGLAAAAHRVAVETAAVEAALKEQRSREAEWDKLVAESVTELEGIRERLIAAICAATDEATRHERGVSLGKGRITFGRVDRLARSPDGGPNLKQSGWTVAAWCFLEIQCTGLHISAFGDPRGRYSWSATLVFAATPEDGTFRWREVSFYRQFGSTSEDEPFALNPATRDFDLAFSNVVAAVNVALGPLIIDGEKEAAFHDRWIALLSKAALGSLSRPRAMPIDLSFFA